MPEEFSKFIINLPDRLDRRLEMEEQLNRVGWRKLSKFQKAERPSDAGGFPSIGARGCFLSHLAALERAKPLGNHAVIMEDDLNFVPGFSQLWQQACDQIANKQWSIFYAAHTLADEEEGMHLVAPDKGIVCAHFVIIHRDAIPRIIDGLKTILSRAPGHPLGGPMHVDGAYTTIREQNPDLKTFVNYPSLGYQRSSRSDIADLRLIDRIEVLRPIMNRLRRIKRSLT